MPRWMASAWPARGIEACLLAHIRMGTLRPRAGWRHARSHIVLGILQGRGCSLIWCEPDRRCPEASAKPAAQSRGRGCQRSVDDEICTKTPKVLASEVRLQNPPLPPWPSEPEPEAERNERNANASPPIFPGVRHEWSIYCASPLPRQPAPSPPRLGRRLPPPPICPHAQPPPQMRANSPSRN